MKLTIYWSFIKSFGYVLFFSTLSS